MRYTPTIIRPSSAGQVPFWSRAVPQRVAKPRSGGKSKFEAVGGNGAIIFQDCDGAELGRVSWKKGLVQQDGIQIIEIGGCDGSSSSGSGP